MVDCEEDDYDDCFAERVAIIILLIIATVVSIAAITCLCIARGPSPAKNFEARV